MSTSNLSNTKYFSSISTLEKLGNISEPSQTFPVVHGGKGLLQMLFTKKNVVKQLKWCETDMITGRPIDNYILHLCTKLGQELERRAL